MNEPMEVLDQVGEIEIRAPHMMDQVRPMMPISSGKRKEEVRSNTDIYTRRTNVERETFLRRRINWPY